MEKWAVKKTRCAAQSGKSDLVRTLIMLYQTDHAKFSQEFARALQPDNRTPFGPTSPLYPFGVGGDNYLAVATTDGFCFRTTLKLLGLPAQQSIDSLPEHVTLALIERVAQELHLPVCYPSRPKTWKEKTSIMISSQGDIKHCWLIVKQNEVRDYSTTFIDIASIQKEIEKAASAQITALQDTNFVNESYARNFLAEAGNMIDDQWGRWCWPAHHLTAEEKDFIGNRAVQLAIKSTFLS